MITISKNASLFFKKLNRQRFHFIILCLIFCVLTFQNCSPSSFLVQTESKVIGWEYQRAFILNISSVKEKNNLSKLSKTVFSIEDVMVELSVSKSSAYRLVREALSEKKIRKNVDGTFKKHATFV